MSTPLYQSIDDPLGGVWDLVNRRRIRKDEPGWDIYQVYLSSGGVVLDADPIGQLADLATAKTARVADINNRAAAARNRAMRGKSPWEGISWTIKLFDALAVKAGNASPFAPILPALATAIGLGQTPNSVNAAIAAVRGYCPAPKMTSSRSGSAKASRRLRGITEMQQVDKVLADAVQALAIETLLDGQRGKHADATLTQTTMGDLLTYNWTTGWPPI